MELATRDGEAMRQHGNAVSYSGAALVADNMIAATMEDNVYRQICFILSL